MFSKDVLSFSPFGQLSPELLDEPQMSQRQVGLGKVLHSSGCPNPKDAQERSGFCESLSCVHFGDQIVATEVLKNDNEDRPVCHIIVRQMSFGQSK